MQPRTLPRLGRLQPVGVGRGAVGGERPQPATDRRGGRRRRRFRMSKVPCPGARGARPGKHARRGSCEHFCVCALPTADHPVVSGLRLRKPDLVVAAVSRRSRPRQWLHALKPRIKAPIENDSARDYRGVSWTRGVTGHRRRGLRFRRLTGGPNPPNQGCGPPKPAPVAPHSIITRHPDTPGTAPHV